YPQYRPAGAPVTASGWLLAAGTETGVGLLMGLSVHLVIEGAQLAGHAVGVQAGYSLVTLLDPPTQADLPVMATFYQLVALLIFLQLNVHHWLLRGLAASLVYLPPGTALTNLKAGAGLVEAAAGMWLVGLQIAAPVLVATLLVDVALGFLTKASPQLPAL